MTSVDDLSKEAERAVIGSLLLGGSLQAVSELRPEHFSDKQLALIFNAIAAVAEAGHEVGLPEVAEQLGSNLQQAGGITYLSELAAGVDGTARVGIRYIPAVKRAHKARRLSLVAADAVKAIQAGGDPDDAARALQAELETMQVSTAFDLEYDVPWSV